MRKLLLFLVLYFSIFFVAKAGWVVTGINNPYDPGNIKNYTLTFDGNNEPVAAASMVSSVTSGINSIVIIYANYNQSVFFPILYNGENIDIEVRDFHYLGSDGYVLCGSRGVGANARAFVATIDAGLFQMNYIEYPEISVFYSIWADNGSMYDYYACGKKDDTGVIASINRGTLNFTDFYGTKIPWEYHKIIAIHIKDELLFAASGRNPECTTIGFTTFGLTFSAIASYSWAQITDTASHCVISDYALKDNTVILASSYQNIVTLNPAPLPLTSIQAYHFTLGPKEKNYCVQDIGTTDDNSTIGISVVGYLEQLGSMPPLLWRQAWHGYVFGLSSTSTMSNNHHHATGSYDQWEYYKIRYDQSGEIYTGGYFLREYVSAALFGTPLRSAPICDDIFPSLIPNVEYRRLSTFQLLPLPFKEYTTLPIIYVPHVMNMLMYCDPFKKIAASELSILSIEKESEITTFFDRITVKDTPSGSNYQIYSITGELIQTGTTNPDISTAQLSRGMYILRLETGKSFKFVK